jgi:hypothetical protein
MTIIRFGSDIKLHHLQPVPITGAKGEELCLSYKISIHYFFFPICHTRDGYVFGINVGTNKAGNKIYSLTQFYPLTDSDVKHWQERGLLPNPLPSYKTPFGDLLQAYVLWAILLIALVFAVLSSR